MSRAIAGVFIFSLAFPVLAMIALAANGAFSPDFLSTFLVGGVVTTFVVLALFEIRRLVEQDSLHANHAHEVAAAAPEAEFHGAGQVRRPGISAAVQGTEAIRVPEAPPTAGGVAEETSAEPIVVEPDPTAEVPVTAVAEPETASGSAADAVLAVDDTGPVALRRGENGGSLAGDMAASRPSVPRAVAPVVATGKQKGGRTKRPAK
jgi:hypothetical protein